MQLLPETEGHQRDTSHTIIFITYIQILSYEIVDTVFVSIRIKYIVTKNVFTQNVTLLLISLDLNLIAIPYRQ